VSDIPDSYLASRIDGKVLDAKIGRASSQNPYCFQNFVGLANDRVRVFVHGAVTIF
jgi:hypothetical protein